MDTNAPLPPGKVRIKLEGEFTATELEEIISDLAKARASLEPEVPRQPPSPTSEQEVLVQEETEWSIRRLVTGGLRIWLRNEGLGWLAFTLTADQATGLRQFLGTEPGSTFTPH